MAEGSGGQLIMRGMLKPVIQSLFFFIFLFLFTGVHAQQPVFPENDAAVAGAHIGISIYDPSEGKFLYELNADKFFIPASTLKTFTLYAGMKYLGDSLPGIRIREYNDRVELEGTGDPTLLDSRFSGRAVMQQLSAIEKRIFLTGKGNFRTEPYGPGWSWEDYEEAFMPERSALPLYGNLVHLSFRDKKTFLVPGAGMTLRLADHKDKSKKEFSRKQHANEFSAGYTIRKDTLWSIPFITSDDLTAVMLSDVLHKKVEAIVDANKKDVPIKDQLIRTLPTDTMLRLMMHESDNFLAEQTLMMCSYLRYGFMDEKKLINELLDGDLADIPQKPRWVDGSGLSRYNILSPRDQIFLLEKMEKEFGRSRLRGILPSGGKGTLKGHYLADQPYIFAKSGSMSNNSGLCGYLDTQKGKTLIFSVLINNYNGRSGPVRRLVERFLMQIRACY